MSVRPVGERHVYDLTVEGEHEFFANGILVHNCHVTSPVKFGDLSELEKEQVHWVPKSRGGRSPSPNRIDALVWAVRELEKQVRFAATSASGTSAMKALKKRVSGNVPRQGRVLGGTSGRIPRMP